MEMNKPLFILVMVASLLLYVESTKAAPLPIVDDFGSPLASGIDTNGTLSGFFPAQEDTCNPVVIDLFTGSAGLGPLADNGGPTWTHALLPNNSAIDAADDLVCLATDQRGVIRPQGPHCEIGAFEMEMP